MMRRVWNRVKTPLAGLLWLILCLMCFFNAADAAATAKGVSLRYTAPLSPDAVKEALHYVREPANNAVFTPAFWSEEKSGIINANERTAQAHVTKICGDAGAVLTRRFLSGAWPSEAGVRGCAVSEALAWRLWGAREVTGLKLVYQDTEYEVRGVFAGEKDELVTQEAAASAQARFQNIELTGTPSTDAASAAQGFAVQVGLGSPQALVNGPALASVAHVACYLPLILAAAFCLWRLVQLAASLPRWQRGALWFSAALCLAGALPLLLGLLPAAWVPTRLSDFSFWSALAKTLGQQVESWFALAPTAKDVALKWLLAKQAALAVAACVPVLWHAAKLVAATPKN